MSTPLHTQKALLEERARAYEELKSLVAKATSEKRDLNPEEREKADRIEADMTSLKERADREFRLHQYETDLNTIQRDIPESARYGTTASADEDAEYREAYFRYLRTGDRRELRFINKDQSDTATIVTPTDVLNRLVEFQTTANAWRRAGAIITPATNTFKMPTETELVTVSGVSENGSVLIDQGAYSSTDFAPQRLDRISKVSKEALHFAPVALDQHVFRSLGKGAGVEEELICTSTITSAISAGFTGAGFTHANLVDFIHSVPQAHRGSASFVGSSSSVAAMRKVLSDDGGYPLWQPTATIGLPDRYMGFPVFENDNGEAYANGNSVLIFGDVPYAVMIAEFGPAELTRLNELYAANGLVGFQYTKFWDVGVLSTRALKKYVRSS
jgi:HK97 family phage major capsid protein